MDFGRGDAILKYPELVASYADDERAFEIVREIAKIPYFVAVHLTASDGRKMPPHPELLKEKLVQANVPFILVGEAERAESNVPMNFRLHTDIVQRADKFIGTLSVFNCIAQLAKKPSTVLVNNSIKEPTIYGLMGKNDAHIVHWNGMSVDNLRDTYAEIAEWASHES